MKKEIYGLSRSRDKQGKVVKRSLNDYVNCLHTQVGSARDNMEVYVAELFMEINSIIVAMRGRESQDLTPKHQLYEDGAQAIQEQKLLKSHTMQQLEPRNDGVTNTLTSVQKDNLVAEPLRILEATKQGYAEAVDGDSVNLAVPNSKTRRGRVGKQQANTLDTGCQQGVVVSGIRYRIRKLTPRECFRLMGVDDADIDKIQASGISNSQQYKCAGNSIVVDVLYHIFRKMFVDLSNEHAQQTLF